MKKILFILLLPLSLFGRATYYIDNTNGSDNNIGTNKTSPWKSLINVNTTTFLPGDSVLFVCGGVWNGTLTINNSGLPGQQIVFGSYGTGANPKISGFDTLTGWIKKDANTWTIIDNNLGAVLNMVTINGINQPIGRFPKTGYNTYTSCLYNSSITDSSSVNLPSFTGGEVVVRKNHWVTDRGIVSWQSKGTIYYNYETNGNNYSPTAGYGYFFQNHVNCLTQFGDWCYDGATHKITMYFGATLPSTYTVNAARFQTVLDFPVAKSNVSFIGLDFEGGNLYGLSAVANCSNINFTNCNFNNIGQDGMNFKNGNYITIKNCSITNCNNNGFYNTNGTYNTISNSLVKNIHAINGMGQNGDTNGIGIVIAGLTPAYSNNNTLTSNTISNCGYHGIYILGDGFLVQNNYIDGFCSNKDDGGGIYSYIGKTTIAYPTRRQIINNTITNGTGAVAGTLLPVGSSAHGIYLDNNSSEVTVSGNQITHCMGAGLNSNGNHNCSFINNSITDCGGAGMLFAQVRFLDSNTDPVKPYNLSFTGNTLKCKNTSQLLISFQSQRTGANYYGFAGWGVFNNNNLLSPANSALFFYYNLTDKWPGTALVMTDWQKTIRTELNSIWTLAQ